MADATQPKPSTVAIRAATETDLPHLSGIELSAATRFRSIAELAWQADGDTLTQAELREYMLAPLSLWVATATTSSEESAQLAGFIAVKPLDDALYVAETDVTLEFQGQGIGSKLLQHVQQDCRARGQRMVTLTTDRGASWNAPFYARRGFVEVDARLLGDAHVLTLQHEVDKGFAAERRCAMVWLAEWPVGRPCGLSDEEVRRSLESLR